MRTKERAVSKMDLPAGMYWVGDPCYAFDDQEEWVDLLESANYDASPTPPILEAEARGKRFVGSRTAHGDGSYESSIGAVFPVDAGLLGVVPMLDCESAAPFGMTLMEFDGPVTVTSDSGTVEVKGGTIRCVIETDVSGEEW